MSAWNKFNKLTKLDFDYEGVTPGKIPEIYANSRNQLDIAISIEVEGTDGKPLNLKEEDFKGLMALLNKQILYCPSSATADPGNVKSCS